MRSRSGSRYCQHDPTPNSLQQSAMPAYTDSSRQNRVELAVTDFGPISQAEVELRPLTVLVGPSNTGKSYLAMLIYALHRFWNVEATGSLYLRRTFRIFRPGDFQDVAEDVIEATFSFAKRIFDGSQRQAPADKIQIPSPLAKILRRSYEQHGIHLKEEICRCFGIEDTATLIRQGSRTSSNIAVYVRNSKSHVPIIHRLEIRKNNEKFTTSIPDGVQLTMDMDWQNRGAKMFQNIMEAQSTRSSQQQRELRDLYTFEIFESLTPIIHPLIVGPLINDAFYLPADRTGVMHAHSVVVSALIGSAAMAGVRPATRTPMLSGVLADFLEELIELGRRPNRRRKSRRSPGDGIENSILRGAIGVEKSDAVGYPHFTYKPEGWKDSLSLANASSMVSELAPIILYLRHVVGFGDMLIIEEPESHLHPAMQVQLTREIARLVRAGIRVVVTTHSEWVLEELANIVGRSGFPKPETEALGSTAALPASDVGVWLFEPKERPRGSVVREIPLDESGLYPTGFEEVAAALHNDWADISSRSQETD